MTKIYTRYCRTVREGFMSEITSQLSIKEVIRQRSRGKKIKDLSNPLGRGLDNKIRK